MISWAMCVWCPHTSDVSDRRCWRAVSISAPPPPIREERAHHIHTHSILSLVSPTSEFSLASPPVTRIQHPVYYCFFVQLFFFHGNVKQYRIIHVGIYNIGVVIGGLWVLLQMRDCRKNWVTTAEVLILLQALFTTLNN